MIAAFDNQNGLNIIGQGGKIILFTAPSLLVALLLHFFAPELAAIPERYLFLKPLGHFWLIPGLLLWGTAVVQLFTGFYKGKLITTGAYGIVRNPIYCSFTFFILPAVSLLTQTWVYFVVAGFVFTGVMIFIGKEEKELLTCFGKKYEDYCRKVDRIIPFVNP